MAFTKKVENPNAERWVPDTQVRGLGVRARGSSPGVFQIRYNYLGKSCRLTFASSDQVTPVEARAWAHERFADLARGKDPAAARVEEEAKAKKSFGSYVPGYLLHMQHEARAASHIQNSRRSLEKYFSDLHRYEPGAIDRKMVAELLIRIRDDHGKIAATRSRGHLSAMFTWLCEQGIAAAVPTEKTTVYKNPARERVLSDDEIRRVWRALDDDDFGDIMRLLFLSGARKSEFADLAWSEIDFANRQVCLPAARVKNRKAFTIFLSRPAIDILRRRKPRPGSEFVFGVGAGGFSGWGRAKRRLDFKTGILVPWIVHDIRRSTATLMGDKLKVAPHIIEATLNHISGHKAGVAGIYQRSEYKDERRAALEAVGDYIAALVA
jgi:integrase